MFHLASGRDTRATLQNTEENHFYLLYSAISDGSVCVCLLAADMQNLYGKNEHVF